MTTTNNVILNVENQSLLFAIDKQLDNELKQDVKLSYDDWVSVFNILKKDQITTNKSQFGENDTDIRNSNHFVVQKNENYEINYSVWQQIVNIAKRAMNINTKNEQGSIQDTKDSEVKAQSSGSVPETSSEPTPEQTTEQTVRAILENNIEVSEERFQEILKKYTSIVQYCKDNNINIDNTTIKDRILNYAKGLEYHDKEKEFATSWANDQENNEKIENARVTNAMNSGDLEAFKDAFHQMAREYIETYDNEDGDRKIDIRELMAMEERELGRALTEAEKEIIRTEAINRIAILDQNGDNQLDENEIAAYLWTMSKINDGRNGKTANDITFNEWKTTQESMGILSLGEDITQDDRNKYALFDQALKNGYNALKK